MEVIKEGKHIQQMALSWKRETRTVVLVPTMGALHDGHIKLLGEGRRLGDVLVMSLFVNPTQFSPSEDISAYPRNYEGDLEKAASCEVDYVFAPSASEIYPSGFQTFVEVERLARGLCGAFRSGHFRGVCTVVTILLNLVLPDLTVFGEKDYQQLLIIRRLVQELRFPVKIISVPTVRDANGVAVSSRNRKLSDREKKAARCLYDGLRAGLQAAQRGRRSREEIVSAALKVMTQEPLCRVEYVELRDADTLEPVASLRQETVLAAAAWIGETRLIDNIRIPA